MPQQAGPMRTALAIVVGFVLLGCGGGEQPDAGSDAALDAGPRGDGLPPTVQIMFPPARSLTEAATILVRGTASDPDGVASIRVNGIAAVSNDGYATWTANVPLVFDANQLAVEAVDSVGNRNPAAAMRSVRSTPAFIRWTNSAASDWAGRLYFDTYSGGHALA